MYKTAAITACLAGVVAGLQLPTRRQFGLGLGTAAVVPPALAAGGKVVVVGGAGFVGTEISHLLATQGVMVCVGSNFGRLTPVSYTHLTLPTKA